MAKPSVEPVAAAQVEFDHECDVLVVGFGAAGAVFGRRGGRAASSGKGSE
ncbi:MULTISPECIES: hypothetical protein [unclassified Spirillospora]